MTKDDIDNLGDDNGNNGLTHLLYEPDMTSIVTCPCL